MTSLRLASPIMSDHEQAERLLEVLPLIRRLLHRLCWSHNDLDDLTQEVLIEVAKALPRFDGRSKLTTYVHTITVRVAYRWLAASAKRNARHTSLELVPPPIDAVDPESHAAAREALRRLYRCLDRMAPKLRLAFLLCEVHGLEQHEAAVAEGVSPTTMRVRLFRARREVRRRLAGDPFLSMFMATDEVSDV